MSRAAVQYGGYSTGCLLIALGVFLLFGIGVALIVAGVLTLATFLFLVDDGSSTPDKSGGGGK